MRRFLASAIRKSLGGVSQRDGAASKELPIPLVVSTARRQIYFYDLLTKIDKVQGNIVECGVGWGRSLFLLATLADVLGQDRQLYGFDSFQGFPEPSAHDDPRRLGIKKGRYATTKAGVIRYLLNSGLDSAFIQSRIHLVEGFFSDTLPAYDAGPIALLHIDCDIYQSYKEALQHLYPKVSMGGIIALDEYQSTVFPGAKKAVDEFMAGKEQLTKSNIVDRFYIVKA